MQEDPLGKSKFFAQKDSIVALGNSSMNQIKNIKVRPVSA